MNRGRASAIVRSMTSTTTAEDAPEVRRDAAVDAGEGDARDAGAGTRLARAPSEVRYAVKRGDSIHSIARAHGITCEELVEANALGVRRSIEIGQVLRLPLNLDRASYAVRTRFRAADVKSLGTTPATSHARVLAPFRHSATRSFEQIQRQTSIATLPVIGVNATTTASIGAVVVVAALFAGKGRRSAVKRASMLNDASTMRARGGASAATSEVGASFNAVEEELGSLRETIHALDAPMNPATTASTIAEVVEKSTSTIAETESKMTYSELKEKYLAEDAKQAAVEEKLSERERVEEQSAPKLDPGSSFFEEVRNDGFDVEAGEEEAVAETPTPSEKVTTPLASASAETVAAEVVKSETSVVSARAQTDETWEAKREKRRGLARERIQSAVSAASEKLSTTLRTAAEGDDDGDDIFSDDLPVRIGEFVYELENGYKSFLERLGNRFRS